MEKPSYHVEPYRRMLPGIKLRETGGGREDGGEEDGERGEGEREEEEEEEEEEMKSVPTPRKRLINFKIPFINRGSQRRGQSASVVTRRRLFSEEGDKMRWERREGRGRKEGRGRERGGMEEGLTSLLSLHCR